MKKPKLKDKPLIVKYKNKVISTLFEIIFRIEIILQDTAFLCIQQLIDLESDAKSLLSTD